ncbi:MAG: hypothetical protein IH620_01815 [Ignavibacterium sp.]|nr:hypothetical protein [Ignavibacterium sp.]HCY76740.1 hypothetical protein [Ignavibacteriales bacterium]
MKRYLVETTHKKEQCLTVMKNFALTGHIKIFNWGCKDGVCTGWAIIKADSKGEALLSVPAPERNTTRVIEVKKFGSYHILVL